jgi:hypothetical protein
MSYTTFKTSLTSEIAQGTSLHDALENVTEDTSGWVNTKTGIIETIFIPAKDGMTDYIKARQQYLNDNEPSLPMGSNIAGTRFEWRSPLTHTFAPFSLSTENAYGQYSVHNGLLTDWAIERWQKYKPNTTHNWTLCSIYDNQKETFYDLDQSKLDVLEAAPYSLDINGIHSLTNLKQLGTSWYTGMKWIWATNQQYMEYSGDVEVINPAWASHGGIYNSWGINDKLTQNQTAVDSLCATLAFKNQLIALNSQY